MKKNKFIIGFICVFVFCCFGACSATTYYVDNSHPSASDSNPGTSPDLPFETTTAVSHNSYQPGDRIRFKRGCVWHDQMLKVWLSFGTVENPIVIEDYGTGDKPIIRNLYVDQELKPSVWLWECDHITIQNLDVQIGSVGVTIDGCKNVIVQNCKLGSQSRTNALLVMASNSGTISEYCEIRNNEFVSGYSEPNGYIPPSTEYGDHGVALYNGANYCLVHDNTFRNFHHAAIHLQVRDPEANVEYNKIYNNFITAPNISYGRAFGTGSDRDFACQYNEFFHNTITEVTVVSGIGGNNNIVSYNLFYSMNQWPRPTSDISLAIAITPGWGGDGIAHDNVIGNNLIYDIPHAGIAISVYGAAATNDSIRDNSITNNIMMDCGWAENRGPIALMIYTGTGPSIIENNIIYAAGIDDTINYRDSLADPCFPGMSVDTFNSQNGNLGDTIQNNFKADPLFQLGFHLTSNSPAFNAGKDIGLLADFIGNPILDNPDIGAFELQQYRSDINTDGITDWLDLRLFCADWLAAGPGDIDEDGTIESDDFALLTEHWLAEPLPYPGQATNPYPADGTTDADANTVLSWTAASAFSYDLYFGTTTSPGLIASGLTETNYTPALSPAITYYWRIDSSNTRGATQGNVWSFTTRQPVAPTADFTASPPTGPIDLVVNFTDTSTGDVDSWSWDFGDSTTSTLPNPSHTYNQIGTYTVQLDVSGPAGADTQIKTDYITAEQPAIFSDDYESGGDWDDDNGTVTINSDAAYNGSNGLELKMNAWILKNISTAGYSDIHFKYARETVDYDPNEYLVVEWQDGSTWNQVESTADTNWAEMDFTLPAGADNNADFKIRFSAGGSANDEYAHIDDVEITGTP